MGPCRYPFAGALSRHLNYARDPAPRVAAGDAHSNQSLGQAGSSAGRGGTPGPLLPVPGAVDTQEPLLSWGSSGRDKTCKLGPRDGPLRSFFVLSVLMRCWFWKVPLPHGAQMRTWAPAWEGCGRQAASRGPGPLGRGVSLAGQPGLGCSRALCPEEPGMRDPTPSCHWTGSCLSLGAPSPQGSLATPVFP